MTHDFSCTCGNPDCGANGYFRKGYVHINHPDGKKEVRWDELYITTIEPVSDNTSAAVVEMMLSPAEARSIMWWFVRMYCPGISRAYELWRRVCHRLENAWYTLRKKSS